MPGTASTEAPAGSLCFFFHPMLMMSTMSLCMLVTLWVPLSLLCIWHCSRIFTVMVAHAWASLGDYGDFHSTRFVVERLPWLVHTVDHYGARMHVAHDVHGLTLCIHMGP